MHNVHIIHIIIRRTVQASVTGIILIDVILLRIIDAI